MFFFTGGLLAMAIRTELLSPTTHVFSADTYIKIVSEHGTIMMMMASSVVVGPLGNYFVPLMIGARRMAYPRIEAFSLWTFMAGYMVIFSALFFGGFPTGWTGYAPLQTQAGPGMISYLFGFAVISIGMMAAGFNLAATIINYRAPGMTWSRVPVFVWSIIATAALLTLASPVLLGGRTLRDPRQDGADRVLRHRTRGEFVPLGEPLLVLRSPRGLHHGVAGLWHRR